MFYVISAIEIDLDCFLLIFQIELQDPVAVLADAEEQFLQED